MSFVLTRFGDGIYTGKDDCPDGTALTTEQDYLLSLSPEERARLQRPENAKELTARWKGPYVRGPHYTNMCTNMELFADRPPQRTVQGKISYGLHLADGAGPSANGCAHDEFRGPDGEVGVDNQLYRAAGCHAMWRGPKNDGYNHMYDGPLKNGQGGIVMLLRGVDNLIKDDNVEVILATTTDLPILDSERNFVSGATYHVTDKPRWRNVLKGHIVNGVLTTEPKNILLAQPWPFGGKPGATSQWQLQAARLRLVFQPDGTVKGILGAYEPLLATAPVPRFGGIGVADTANIDCAALYAAIAKYADGDRDPKTGRCTTISMANNVEAKPAFVFDTSAGDARK